MAVPTVRVVLPKVNSLVTLKSWAPNSLFLSRTRTLTNHFVQQKPAQTYYRSLHKSATQYNNPNYEPDGKTTVTILNDEFGAPLMIDSYTQNGFKLNNGIQVIGPMIIFPRTVLGWDVGGSQDISPSSLALFSILEPKPDVLVIGIGDSGAKMPVETIQFLKKKKINVEILSTEHACTTFNFLSCEGRCAAAVMIPPTRIVWTAFDIANTKLRKQRLYEDDDGPDPDPQPAK